MRLPNGYGSVVKLSGNRRNPFVVRKTREFNVKGHAVFDIVGYYPTREAGLIALAEYNKAPYDLTQDKTTLEELYKLWEEKKAPKLGKCNLSNLKSAYKHCSALTAMKYKEIKAFHMQGVIDSCGHGYGTQAVIKNLFSHLDKFASEMDLINRCYSDLLSIAPAPETNKCPFTDEEIDKLWEIQDKPWVDSVLVFLYTGFRISELLGLKKADTDIEAGTLKGGIKTTAGKNRVVPIHSRILPFITKRMAEPGEYLFSYEGRKLAQTKYYSFWDEVMGQTGMQHTPHECRHTLRSRLDSAGANKVCIDLIMGHKSKDVGERVYTHKTIQELRDTIALLD